MVSFDSNVVDSVDHDVVDVVVNDRVRDFATPAISCKKSGTANHPKVLRHKRLRRPGRLDEFVNALGPVDQRDEHRETQRVSYRLEQLRTTLIHGIGVSGYRLRRHQHIVTSQYCNTTI